MLYDVFLHELGHLQIIDGDATTVRRMFAMETKAQEFGMYWCERLWAERFDHPDPVHNPPTEAEFADDDPELTELVRRTERRPDDAELLHSLGKRFFERGRTTEAREAYERSLALDPENPWTLLLLGNWHYSQGELFEAVERFTLAAELMPGKAVAYWCLAELYEAQGRIELADANFRQGVEADPTDKQARKKLLAWQKRSLGSPA